MLLRLVGDPDLVVEGPPLALLVREGAEPVRARVELAGDLEVGELAVRGLALAAIPTRGHGRVPEDAARILAVGEELAVLLALVGDFGRGRRVSANAFAVFTRYAKGADIVGVDGCARGCGRRLVGKLALFVGAVEVVFADHFLGVRRFSLSLGHVHILTDDMAPSLGCV